jgi:hypothetical protein
MVLNFGDAICGWFGFKQFATARVFADHESVESPK